MSKSTVVSLVGLCVFGLSMGFVGCAPQGPEESEEEAASSEQDELRKGQFCGGFANIQCPTGQVCVDDPSDNCNPKKGGADCGGICRPSKPGKKDDVCNDPDRSYVATDPDQCMLVKFFCAEGSVAFFDDCGCGCETGVAPVQCGASTCEAGEYCCNESCGICAPEGGVCTQQFCEPI